MLRQILSTNSDIAFFIGVAAEPRVRHLPAVLHLTIDVAVKTGIALGTC